MMTTFLRGHPRLDPFEGHYQGTSSLAIAHRRKIMRGGLYLWPFPFRASFLRTVKTPWSSSDPVLFTRAVPYWCFKKTKHFFSVCVPVCAHAWSSADALESVLLFHQVGFGNQMHILRLGGRWPSLMSHLISSSHALFKDGWSFSF